QDYNTSRGAPGGDYEGSPDVIDLLARSPAASGLRTLRLRRPGSYYASWTSLASPSYLTGLTTLELEDVFLAQDWLRGLAEGALPSLKTPACGARFCLPGR